MVVLSNYVPRGRDSGSFLSEGYMPWVGGICKCLGANAWGFPGVKPLGWPLISALCLTFLKLIYFPATFRPRELLMRVRDIFLLN